MNFGININQLLSSSTVDEAIEMIRAEKLDRIYCSLTGIEYAMISADEIRQCLLVDIESDAFASADSLVDGFATRQAIMSSGPCPSLRLYRNRNVLLSVLRADPTGPNRLFGYLAGRLFFESIASDRDQDSFDLRKSKMAFLVELQGQLAKLPKGWHESLTPHDETDKSIPAAAMNVMHVAFKTKPTEESQEKLAQRCLEKLIQIDGIFNLRAKIYSAEMLRKLEAFRDESNIEFSALLGMLEQLESDAVIRTDRSNRTPQANAQIVSLALVAIGWRQTRVDDLADIIEEQTAKRRIREGTTAQGLIESISRIMEAAKVSGTLDARERKQLESSLHSLKVETQMTRKRTEQTIKVANRANDNAGKVQIRRGEKPLVELAEVMKSQGRALPKEMADRLKAISKTRANNIQTKPRVGGRPMKIRGKEGMDKLMSGLNLEDFLSTKNDKE